MSRDSGVKKGSKAAKTPQEALAALDDSTKARTSRVKTTALKDGFVGTAGREERGDASAFEARGGEDNQRTHDEGTALTREDVIRLLREANMENALPPCPKIPGWHTCWLSTTNQYDSIPSRERLGYIPVGHHELRGFDNAKVHSGDHQGMIVVNEMILYKVPEDIYQAIMKFCHHDKPNEEAGRIVDSIEEIKEEVGRKNLRTDGDDDEQGVNAMREEIARRAPHFD